MAQKFTKREPFTSGETASFIYRFPPVYPGFDWSLITLDAVFTADTSPTTNSNAIASRTGEVLSVDSSNVASYQFQLTPAESNQLVPGKTYYDACALREGTSYVLKPTPGQVTINQDYIK